MTGVVEAARAALLILLALLTVKSFLHARRGPGGAARWLTLSFAVLTVVVGTGVLMPDLAARQGSPQWKLAVCLLLLFPASLGRFIEALGVSSPSRFRRLASIMITLGLVLATLAMPQLGGGPDRPGPYRVYALAFVAGWTTLSVAAAWSLWQAGRSWPTVVRRRLRTLSLGTLMVNVVLLLLGSLPPSHPPTQLVVLLLGTAGAVLFFVGFAPPGALRAVWRQPELDLNHAAECRLMAAEHPADVARMIVPQAAALLGGAAAFFSDGAGRLLAHQNIEPGEARRVVAELDRVVPSGRGGVAEPVPGFLARRLRQGWLVVAAGPITALFGREERRLLDALGHSAELAMERMELFERDDARRRVLEESERQLAQAQRLARLGSWEWQLTTGTVTWSREMFRIYDLEPSDLHGDADYDWFRSRSHPDDRAVMEAAVRATAATGRPFEVDHRLVMPDGEIRWLHSRGQLVVAEDGTPQCLQGTAQEITASKEAEAELSRRVTQQAVVALLGQEALEGVAMDALRRAGADLVARVLDVDAADASALLERPDSGRHGETGTFGGADEAAGSARRSLDDADDSFLSAVRHVLAAAAQRQRAEADLAHQALHDPLTGLPNRVLLADRLEQAASRGQRKGGPLAVLFLDLDRFKVVNDGLGHGAGDELLRVLAGRLVETVRPGDTVARFGGDEFVVLCEDLDESAATALAARISERLAQPVPVAGREVAITASVGIVVADPAGTSPEELIRDADSAMYQAKERGRARSQLFGPSTRRQVLDRLDTEVTLHRALERNELRLRYQPEISLEDGRIVGLEALLRWEHPELGLLLPSQFLAVAEETGLIVPIGEWVLGEACRQVQAVRAERPDLAPVVVWVNLSARQLAQPDLVAVIARILAATGTDPALLGLEITETVFQEDVRSLKVTLRQLRRLGVQLAIDDFGTGFSSLSRLRQFPVDVLKIDRSFVQGMTEGRGDRAIVSAVVGLARSLDLVAVAEGVHVPDEVAALRALGCDVAQGFYFCEPVDHAALRVALADGGWPEVGEPAERGGPAVIAL